MKTSAILAVLAVVAVSLPAIAQTPTQQAQRIRIEQAQLNPQKAQLKAQKRALQARRAQLQAMNRQQDALDRQLRQQQQLQQRNYNARVFNNNNARWNSYGSVGHRIAVLRSQIPNTMDSGVKARLIMELKHLEGRW